MHGQSRRSEGPARYSNCERTDNGDCDRERISLDRHFASKSYCGENNDADAWLLKWVASLVVRAVTTFSGKSRNGCDSKYWSICATRACDQQRRKDTTCCRWAGQPLGRAVTAISPLTPSLEGAATLFRTRPLPCHHPLSGNWAG